MRSTLITFKLAFFLLALFYINILQSQNIAKVWDKRFGSAGENVMAPITGIIQHTSILTTSDGGFLVMAFTTLPFKDYDLSQNPRGGTDFWLIKTNSQGVKIWDKPFGGSNNDRPMAVIESTDGGFIVAGYSDSGISGDKTQNCRGDYDFWVLKISASGVKIWDKRFGGNTKDVAFSLVSTPDGGCLVGGYTQSNVGADITEATRGGKDFWAVRIDATGNKIWDRRFGGSNNDAIGVVASTSDGGFLLAGSSNSNISGDKTQNAYNTTWNDIWVVKIDSLGTKIWDKRYGYTDAEEIAAIIRTPDNGFILGGFTLSDNGGDISDPFCLGTGSSDCWILKINENGDKIWDKRYGGSRADGVTGIVENYDGSYLVACTSNSNTGCTKTSPITPLQSNTYEDYWVFKMDSLGNKYWDKDVGGTQTDKCWGVTLSGDSCFVLVGLTLSDKGNDLSEDIRKSGNYDFWLIKLNPECPELVISTTSANPATPVCKGQTVILTANSDSAMTYTWQPDSLIGATITVNPGSTTIYTVTGSYNNKCTTTATIEVKVLPVCPDTLLIKGRVFLQGCYQSDSMNLKLNIQGLLPTMQPYNTPPFNYSGSQQYTSLPADAVDWILVELRDTSSFVVLYREATLVYKDGSFNAKFVAPSGSYIVSVSHRNHLTIGTANPVDLIHGLLQPIDFTNPSTLGGGAGSCQTTANGSALMLVGDGNADKYISHTDYLLWQIVNSGIMVYLPADYNMDGFVTMSDYLFWQLNNTRFSYFAD